MTLILSGTDGLSDVDGSAATPAIRGTDANTGIFFPAADTIAFSEGGVEAMRIDSSGNVGIGTSSPSAKLDLNTGGASNTMARFTSNGSYYSYILSSGVTSVFSADTSGNNAFTVRGASNQLEMSTNGSERMRIDSSGNVGIGTTYIPSASGVCKIVVGPPGTSAYSTYANPVSSTNVAFINAVNNSSDSYLTMLDIGGLTGNTDAANGGSAIRFLTQPKVTPFAAIERMRIDSSGNLLVGTTTNSGNARIAVSGAGTGGAYLLRLGSSATGAATADGLEFVFGDGVAKGSIRWNTSVTAYNTASDYRLKENIAPMTGALSVVSQLKPCTYTWKVDGSEGQGFIAHELQAVVPDCVTGEKDAVDAEGNPQYQGIDTSFLVATLTAAIQELKALVDTQASTITQLQADVAALKGTA